MTRLYWIRNVSVFYRNILGNVLSYELFGTVHILYITLACQTICHITLSVVNNLICLFPVVQYIKISSRSEIPRCCLGQCKIGAIHKGLFMPSHSSEGSKYGVTLLNALSWTNILHVANLFTQLDMNSLKFGLECCWHSFLCW